MSHQANGSLVERGGKVIGSSLAAPSFSFPGYFHERPSATAPPYNPAFTTFSNLGPTNPALAKLVKQNAAAILKLEGPYNPGLTIHQIPVDAVVPSGSGIDPEISIAYANLQARRVAAVRRLPLATVDQLIHQNTEQRTLGFFGEPGVNVLSSTSPSTGRPADGAPLDQHVLARPRPRCDPGLVPEARPAAPAEEPGHVHRRARQRDHDRHLLQGSRQGNDGQLWFVGVIALWLWLTVLFANFAEAIAEGRGKAQANALRATRTTTTALRRCSDGHVEEVAAPDLQKGDVIVVEAGMTIPADGDVIEGAGSSTSRRSPASRRPSSARRAATARPSRAARSCSPTGS